MPNITVYMDNETFADFTKLTEEKQKELKDNFVAKIKKVLKNDEH